MKLYVCGPMSGLPEFNYPAFQEATALLRKMGNEVVCPTEVSVECGCKPGDHTWVEYLTRDIRHITDMDGLVLLPDWFRSRGATFEVLVAYKLEKDFFRLDAEFGALAEYDKEFIRGYMLTPAVQGLLFS